MSAVFDKIEDVFDGFVDRSTPETVAKLNEVAAGEPGHPGPHVAMSLVTSVSREDFTEAKGHLGAAGERLARIPPGDDPETEMFRALHDFIDAEFQIEGGSAGAKSASKAAFAKLQGAVERMGNPPLGQTLVDAAGALSRANEAGGREHAASVRALESAGNRGKSQDLNDFFLVYAHRKGKDYGKAKRVADGLSRRRPKSALSRRIAGSCAYYANDLDEAERRYQEAVELAPNDPTTHLGLGRVLRKKGDNQGARRALGRAKREDRKGRLGKHLQRLERDIGRGN